ncbi:MAG: hypothetical protein ACR2PZ_05080, partial [Pseudomonadales bacterium]
MQRRLSNPATGQHSAALDFFILRIRSPNGSPLTQQNADPVEPLLTQALAQATRKQTPTRLRRTLRWISPATGDCQETAVVYAVDAHRATVIAEVAGTRVDLAAPVRLAPIAIPKPWGQELWYSGMEARGEAEVDLGEAKLPLSLYLSLAPGWLHQDQPIVLLKILDPLAQPVVGDLYFEVHERKEEVYVVTAVDQQAWPDGVGAIRFGMNQELRSSFPSDTEFRAAYLTAVQSYEAVRRLLDGEVGTEPSSDEQLQEALSCTEPELALQDLELQRRAAMERFTTILPLRIGDIVTVPPWHPHSLQHGVQ